MSENSKISNMANLCESIPYQPIEEGDTEEKARYWAEVALPLVRKVFAELKENQLNTEG